MQARLSLMAGFALMSTFHVQVFLLAQVDDDVGEATVRATLEVHSCYMRHSLIVKIITLVI